MYQTKIASASGRYATDIYGASLYNIGNNMLHPGDYVMTDGQCIYGRHRNQGIPVISVDKLLPILCNNGSELLVFDKNFVLIGKYSCSKTDITAFCNIADYFAMGDINGNIYTSDGEKYNISKLGHFKNYYMANSIAITNDSIYALIARSHNLDEVYEDFSLIKNGKLVYTSYDLFDRLKSEMPLPESKVLEHYGYYYIPDRVLNVGWPDETRARIEAIMKDPVSAGAFHDEESDNDIADFLDRSSFINGTICLKNENGDIIGYYNFDTKMFDLGVKLGPGEDDDSSCYYSSNYDEQMAAELEGR